MRGVDALPWSKTPSRAKGSRRNLGDLAWPAVATAIPGRDRRSRRRSCRGTDEESDGLVVPMKRPNKPVTNGGGGSGGKGPGRREGRRQSMPRTLCRPRHVTGVACLRTGTAWVAKPRTPVTFDLRQEPGAGKPHAGICAGGREKSLSLPRQPRKNQSGRRRRCHERKAKRGCASTRAHLRSRVVEDPGMYVSSSTGNREVSRLAFGASRRSASGRRRAEADDARA
jgi:hypothetical protein